jgi:hypothetical protein
MRSSPLALSSSLAALLLAACSASPTAPAAAPEGAPAPPAAASVAAADPAASETPAAEDAPSPPPRKAQPAADVPDDYEITPRDCQELAGQFASLIRSDEVAKLSPKLSEQQKAQAVKSIEKAAAVRQEQWVSSCSATLVGLVQQRKNLRCAMEARSVSAFDVCLNGEPTEAAADAGAAPVERPRKKR